MCTDLIKKRKDLRSLCIRLFLCSHVLLYLPIKLHVLPIHLQAAVPEDPKKKKKVSLVGFKF